MLELKGTKGKAHWRVAIGGAAWSAPWKAIALWKAARRNHRGWFAALSVLNTLGILEMIYIFKIAQGRDDGSAMVTATSDAR